MALSSRTRTVLGGLCVLAVSLIWTLSNYLTKYVLDSPRAPTKTFFTFYQLMHNTLFLLPHLGGPPSPTGWKLGGLPALFRQISMSKSLVFASIRIFSLFCYNIGILFLLVNKIALLSSSSPGFSLLFSLLFLQTSVTWRSGLGVAAAITGTVLAVHAASTEDAEVSEQGPPF